ncbi:myrosinase 1-like [Eupeodes corollae]|uniref:myrosinase 1-like n=1 Tax=Eupeodes corollae TaxID=290404 RepID=UPI00248FE2D0|nr:myrosinase 1-like [Eupeodes corollae]
MWILILIINVAGFLNIAEGIGPSGNCTLLPKGERSFPQNFSFGVSTSAYQIEGSWNADGKGPSIWDEFCHNHPDNILDRTNGDIAANSYRRFDLDLEALRDLKVNHYRFSISWTRIYPSGDISSKNQKGIDYYNNVINQLIANGIQPMVTMFHYDLPIELQKLGGLTNELFIDQFVTYADELFKNFGDRVKTWITFNEPVRFCKPGYGTGRDPPQIKASGIGDYLCIANILKSHAAAYHLYRSKYFDEQHGKVGISLDTSYFFSKSNDNELVYRSLQYNLGILAHPIYSKSGGFPEVMVKEIERNSLQEGRLKSRLPSLEGKWKDLIRGSGDFLALNHYTSKYVERSPQPLGDNPSMQRDYDTIETVDENWLQAHSYWLNCVPEGMEMLLNFIRDEYNNIEVIITENGWSDSGEIEDNNRIVYLKSYIQAVLNAINDGCNVTAYSVWSFIDNFEWIQGYTDKFGLYSVNMISPERQRSPKKSARFYRQIIETRKIPNV